MSVADAPLSNTTPSPFPTIHVSPPEEERQYDESLANLLELTVGSPSSSVYERSNSEDGHSSVHGLVDENSPHSIIKYLAPPKPILATADRSKRYLSPDLHARFSESCSDSVAHCRGVSTTRRDTLQCSKPIDASLTKRRRERGRSHKAKNVCDAA